MLEQLLLGLVRGRLVVVLVDMARPMAVLRPQRVDQLEVAGPLRCQLLDPADGRLRRGLAGVRLLVAVAAVRGDPQAADDERQRQPLADECRQDHGERQEDQQVALREGLAVAERRRQGERRRQRDDAAHAGPRDDEHVPRRRPRVAVPDRRR